MTLKQIPSDGAGNKMQLIPKGIAKGSGVISVGTGETPFVPIVGANNFLRVYAVGGNVFLKYSAGVTLSLFDEMIPDGQVVDLVYNTEETPGNYSVIADVACDLYTLTK